MSTVYIKERVCENVEICKGIFKISVKGDFNAVPGQFYMLRSWGIEPLLSRPISVHELDNEKISFLYEVKGEGTKLLSKLQSGDGIELLGPLGNSFDLNKVKGKIAIVTGGVGIAPMFYMAKMLKGTPADLYAGFRDEIYIIDKIKSCVDNIYISTDTGRHGHKGFITDIFNPVEYSTVFCCGPEPMMEKVVKRCTEYDTPIFVSMEKRMACGIGACLVCACKTTVGNKRACKDGPVFSGKDVIFNA